MPFISRQILASASFSARQNNPSLPPTLSRTKTEADIDLYDVRAAAVSLAQVRIAEIMKKSDQVLGTSCENLFHLPYSIIPTAHLLTLISIFAPHAPMHIIIFLYPLTYFSYCLSLKENSLYFFLFMFYIFIQPERPNFRHSKICKGKVNLQSQLKAIFTKIGRHKIW